MSDVPEAEVEAAAKARWARDVDVRTEAGLRYWDTKLDPMVKSWYLRTSRNSHRQWRTDLSRGNEGGDVSEENETIRTCQAVIAGGFAGICDYPADHEIHDPARAKRASWRYHPFVRAPGDDLDQWDFEWEVARELGHD